MHYSMDAAWKKFLETFLMHVEKIYAFFMQHIEHFASFSKCNHILQYIRLSGRN